MRDGNQPRNLGWVRSCGGKIAYETKDQARENARVFRYKKKVFLSTYKCVHCGKFHNGN